MEDRSLIAILPMRHESERVPGKNYRQFGGKPLYHHVVERLLECPALTGVVIDTDSPVILADAAQHFPTVRLLVRPEHLRGGEVPMNDVIAHVLETVEAAAYLQTHSTNPLLRTQTIQTAIESFWRAGEQDSLFSVNRIQARLYDCEFRPLNHDPKRLLRTQDLPPVYLENSNLYLFRRDSFLRFGTRIGERPLLFEMDPAEAADIDTESDWRIAEALYQAGSVGP